MKISQAIAMAMESQQADSFMNLVDKFMADERPDCCDKCAELHDVIQQRGTDMIAEFQNPDMPSYAIRAIRAATALISVAQIMHHRGLDDDSSPESANDNSGG